MGQVLGAVAIAVLAISSPATASIPAAEPTGPAGPTAGGPLLGPSLAELIAFQLEPPEALEPAPRPAIRLALEAPCSWPYSAGRCSTSAWLVAENRIKAFEQKIALFWLLETLVTEEISGLTLAPARGSRLGNYFLRNRYLDPELGRFISADPLGFVDGPSMYAFAGYDPFNSTDPLGLYEVDFHYYVVYLAVNLAFRDPDRAALIAFSSQFVDDFDETKPVRFSDVPPLVATGEAERLYSTLESFHFLAAPDERPVTRATRGNSVVELVRRNAVASGDDIQFGIMLHSYADSFSHEGFVGEINRTHNERPEGPLSHIDPLGHMHAGHTVDEPFNDPEKAVAAAYAIYREAYQFGRNTGADVGRLLTMDEFRKTFKDRFEKATGTKDQRVSAWRRWISGHGLPSRPYDEKRPPNATLVEDFRQAANRQRTWVQDFMAQAEAAASNTDGTTP